ncbi:hypothetical protein A3B45_00895 [Candidatus Daviesbacteria bacterium RIFCSPLOWO2_01_FULL_39_12]|uniref:BrnT family toxin n=1 Tax=Candidatus Daviesbacteria bacterium RIFCSPLOWO2_01_FULL_39_12 TaxID=1797785 RepID=A0A1F5KR28_9BACT|nr:MAG: hypothetical protein A3D79_00045 [Candidatus Daviesbacteria bacterium RIFCSPHIGHO2_02_FULL_39_8]OGE43265.1 MAG: hypothetical protein A3B45_00895 [Candidatus Daviesbacteria bacterium RIFCSPLOWO2_01_FULL_39_12]
MTRIIVKKIIWDEWNVEHIRKHNVTQREVEEISKNIITHKKVKLGRYSIFGRVSSRILTVIINRKATGIYYPVTARDAAKKERRRIYEKEKRIKIS